MKKCKICPNKTEVTVTINHKLVPICNECLGAIGVYIQNRKQTDLFGGGEDKKQPTLELFLKYGEQVCKDRGLNFNDYKHPLSDKYADWNDRGWKDGNNSPIINWKTKLRIILPHLKPLTAPKKEPSQPSYKRF